MANVYGGKVEWTELILNFVGQVAWPAVVLVLGLFFRKPLVKLLTVNGPLKSLSAGSVSAEWEVEARVDRAKDALDFPTSPADLPPITESEEDHGNTHDQESPLPEPPPPAPFPQEPPTPELPIPEIPSPERPATEPPISKPPVTEDHAGATDRLPTEIFSLAHGGPALAILQTAETLTQDLIDLMRESKTSGGASRNMSLSAAVSRAYKLGLLSGEEAEAGRELAIVRNRLAHADKDFRIDLDTALDFVRVSQRLTHAARKRADEQHRKEEMAERRRQEGVLRANEQLKDFLRARESEQKRKKGETPND